MDKCVIISIRKAKLVSVKCVAVALSNRYNIVGGCRRIIELKGVFVSLNRICFNGTGTGFKVPVATSTC